MSWFDTARLGLFVHWGVSSVHGWELSWPLVGGTPALSACQAVSIDAYYGAVDRFTPRVGAAAEWARLARDAGMQYAVLTAKHHDGFALFDTQLSTFSAPRAACGRDLVREFVDAFRAAGLRVGLYFSLSDWHHPDYPAFTEADKPYDFAALPQPNAAQWERYLAVLFGQVRELLTGYGRIDVLWFDGHWERMPMDRWRPHDLRTMIRQLQPAILINDRLPGAGDFETPEQFVPPQPPAQRWETCLTLNESWAYNPADTRYKSPHQVVHTLCEVAGKGGNLLLNVGPMADGSLPAPQRERIEALAGWMHRHSEAIVGTTPGLEPWQFYGPTTRRGERIYLHLVARPYETVTVRGMPVRRIDAVRHVATGTPLPYETRCAILDGLFNPDPSGELTIAVPESLLDPLATVVAVDLKSRG